MHGKATHKLEPTVSSFLDNPFAVRLLDARDINALRQLREVVLATLPDPDLYVREIDEESLLKRNIHSPALGQTVGVFIGSHLIAYGMVSYPAPTDEHNLGHWLSLPKDELASCAFIESAMVHPDHRCCGWQKLLLRIRTRLAEERGKRILTAVASLKNWVGRHNLLGAGYVIAGCAELPLNLRRHIFIRYLDLPTRYSKLSVESAEVCPLDFAKQRDLICDGFIGIAEYQTAHGRALIYKNNG